MTPILLSIPRPSFTFLNQNLDQNIPCKSFTIGTPLIWRKRKNSFHGHSQTSLTLNLNLSTPGRPSPPSLCTWCCQPSLSCQYTLYSYTELWHPAPPASTASLARSCTSAQIQCSQQKTSISHVGKRSPLCVAHPSAKGLGTNIFTDTLTRPLLCTDVWCCPESLSIVSSAAPPSSRSRTTSLHPCTTKYSGLQKQGQRSTALIAENGHWMGRHYRK